MDRVGGKDEQVYITAPPYPTLSPLPVSVTYGQTRSENIVWNTLEVATSYIFNCVLLCFVLVGT